MVLCFGLIAGGLLFFQSSAVADGARGGARMASIETSLKDTGSSGGGRCASGSGESLQPASIESAVAKAAPALSVNPNQLCINSAYVGTPAHPYELTQASAGSGFANITVDVTYDTTKSPPVLVETTVTVSLSVAGTTWPLNGVYQMSGHSTDPVFSG